jgi:putative hemolysin
LELYLEKNKAYVKHKGRNRFYVFRSGTYYKLEVEESVSLKDDDFLIMVSQPSPDNSQIQNVVLSYKFRKL